MIYAISTKDGLMRKLADFRRTIIGVGTGVVAASSNFREAFALAFKLLGIELL